MPDPMPDLSPAASAAVRARPLCVCVPARNEAARLPQLLAALADQSWPGCIPVVVVVNNSTDASMAVLAQAWTAYRRRLDIHAVQVVFSAQAAHAGSARRLAMDEGLKILPAGEDGVLISTDADARPPREWIANMMAAFARGADMVGGQILIDDAEPLPPHVAQLHAAWDLYWQKVRAIEDAIDPLPWDLPPRHGDHTGASLAISAQAYRASGGVPLLPSGEDRALVLAAMASGARLVHPANVQVRVSPRRTGRAQGGMAQAMEMLFDQADRQEWPMVPAYHHWQQRAMWRRGLRTRPGGCRVIARQEGTLPPMPHDMRLEQVG